MSTEISSILQQIVNALTIGSVYALLAIGFSMVYGILRLINFAHGDVFMLGAYFIFLVMRELGLDILAGAVVAAVMAGIVGLIIERSAFRPLRGAPEGNLFISSLAVSMIIQNGVIMILGPQPQSFKVPGILGETFQLGSVVISNVAVVTLLVTFIMLILLILFVTKTKLGIAMRATASNLEACSLMGIQVNRVIAIAFFISSLMAGVGGILWATRYTLFNPLSGAVPGIKAFIGALIGGIGSFQGAVIGGYLLGILEVLVVLLLPAKFSAYRDVFVFTLLVVTLLVRPQGIMGKDDK
jgi:branched-chain amino acid transport system permease protein